MKALPVVDTALYDVDEFLVLVDSFNCLPGKLCHECYAHAVAKRSSFGLQFSSSSKQQPERERDYNALASQQA